jgi:hypothetical protein
VEKIKSFKELKVWQKGIEIVKDAYALTKKFPKEEIYGLTAQIRRSAISIPYKGRMTICDIRYTIYDIRLTNDELRVYSSYES